MYVIYGKRCDTHMVVCGIMKNDRGRAEGQKHIDLGTKNNNSDALRYFVKSKGEFEMGNGDGIGLRIG